MPTKWKNPECPESELEIIGTLFKRTRCSKREQCEKYSNNGNRCEKEKVAIAKLKDPVVVAPEEGDSKIYLLNNSLLDCGEYHSFDEIRDAFELQETNIGDHSYWNASKGNRLKMLYENRNFIFVIYSKISGDVAKQHELIFKQFNACDWIRLIQKNPEFKQDYITLDIQRLLSDYELVCLLALFPDLDPKAYDARKKSFTGDMWVMLLSNGVGGERDKFWNECPYDKLSIKNWDDLFTSQNAAVSQKAEDHFKKEFGITYTDEDWRNLPDTIRKRVENPGFFNFGKFYEHAPEHAAKEQFKSMFLTLGVFSLVVLGIAVLVTGNAKFVSIPSVIVSVLCFGGWSWGISKMVSKKKSSYKKMVLNSILFGLLGGWILPHTLLLILGFCGITGALQTVFCAIVFLGVVWYLFFICDKIHRNVSYVLAVLLGVGYIAMGVHAPHSGHVGLCRNLNLAAAEKYYLNRLLAKHDYVNRWKKACTDGKIKEIYRLSRIWDPDPVAGTIHDDCCKELINAMLDEYEGLKEVYSTLKLKSSDFAQRYFADRVISEKNLETKYKFAEIFYGIYGKTNDYNAKVRKNILDFAAGLNLRDKNFPLEWKYKFYDVVKNHCTQDETRNFFRELKDSLKEYSSYPFKLDEIKKLAEYPALQNEEDKAFWCNIMLSSAVGSYYDKAKKYLSQLAEENKFPKDFVEAIHRKYTEVWKNKAERKFDEFLENLDRRIMNELCSNEGENQNLAGYLKEQRKVEFYFWAGWSFYKQDNKPKAWEYLKNVLDIMIDPQRAPEKIRKSIDNALRKYTAELATENNMPEQALALWKACYQNRKVQEYWEKILECSRDENDKISVLQDPPRDVDPQLFRKYIDLPFARLNNANISEGDLVKMLDLIYAMYENKIENMPEDKRQKFEKIVIAKQNRKYSLLLVKYHMEHKQYRQIELFNGVLSNGDIAGFVEKDSGFDKKMQGEILYGIAMQGKDFEKLYKEIFKRRFNPKHDPLAQEFPTDSKQYYFLQKAVEKSHPRAMIIHAVHLCWDVARDSSGSINVWKDFLKECRTAAGSDKDLIKKIDELSE